MEGRKDPYQFDVGSAEVEPKTPVVAGSYATWKLRVRVGKFGSDEGSRILVCRRLSCDMEIPQYDDPSASGYVTATCSNPDVKLQCSNLDQGYIDDWRAGICIKTAEGYFRKGDIVEVILGDTSGGGPGIRVQTFPEKRHTFKVLMDTFNINHFYEIDDSPEVEVVPGDADHMHVVYPQNPVKGEEFDVVLRVVDAWGNPVRTYEGDISFEECEGWSGLPANVHMVPGDRGIKRIPGVTVDSDAPLRLTAVADDGMETAGPGLVARSADEMRLMWGDAHGQTRSTVGTGTVEEFYAHARDRACVDIASWQGNDLRVRREDWEEVIRETGRFYDPGRFVTLLGYEWSGLRTGGGDYNIYYAADRAEIHRSSHARVEEYDDLDTDRFPLTELWKTFRGREDVIAVGHIGGRCCNLDFYDPEFVKLIEIHSHHGTFEWLLEDALKRGLKVGFTGASDDHTGRLGLVYPNCATNSVCTFDVNGGLMGLYAMELTREAVFDAMRRRRVYGTNGARIGLVVKSGEHWMGEEIDCSGNPDFTVRVNGTSPLLDIELKRGLETIYRHPLNVPEKGRGPRRIRLQWSGVSQMSGRRKQVRWDGHIELSDGSIVGAEPFALDQDHDRVRLVGPGRVELSTRTSGDFDGVILDIDSPEEARLKFVVGFYEKEIALGDISSCPLIERTGLCNTELLVSEVSQELTEFDAEFTFVDENPQKDCSPYWIRVSQLDGGQAWSSPIFINR